MKTQPVRQRIRKALLIFAVLLFPATYYYLSPYLIVVAAHSGIMNGSLIVFLLQFFSALLVGRAWCGWLCPAGGLYTLCRLVNDRPVHGGKLNLIKYVIWLPWISLIAWQALAAGGYTTVDFFYQTEQGVSASNLPSYIMFLVIIGSLTLLAMFLGRQAPCHYVCWMAPFMIIGTQIKNVLKWPSLHLRATSTNCINCTLCTTHCPMSLNVNRMVQGGSMRNAECILCGECADHCPKACIHYAFGVPR